MKKPKPTTGQLIRQHRKLHNWRQADLAEVAGLDPAVISRYERGAAEPSIANLKRLATALEVEPGELIS